MKKLTEYLALKPEDIEKMKTEDLSEVRLFLQNTRIAVQEKQNEVVKVLDARLAKEAALKKLSPEEQKALGLTQTVKPDSVTASPATGAAEANT